MPRLFPPSLTVVRAAAVLASAGALWSFAAPPAVAGPLDPVQIDMTDPIGDASGGDPGLDITGFSITQDRVAKTVRGTVTFNGNVAEPDRYHLRIGLGLENGTTGCNTTKGYGWIHIRHLMGTQLADYAIATNTDRRQNVDLWLGDQQITFQTPSAPDAFNRGFRCITVQTELYDEASGEEPFDEVTGFAPPEVEETKAVLDPGNGIPAPILDADGDGVHDGIDKCPQVPGAATSGCETVPEAKSIKLGTKRLVIDRLLATTAGNCPSQVKVVATLGKKSLARQKMGTIKKGRFCHVLGVVTLKKRVAKARVVISGAGVTSVALTVKK